MSAFLPSTKYINVERTVTVSTVVEDSDQVLNCDTTLAAVTVNLKMIPTNYWSTMYRLYIKDSGNNAATNNITIVAPTGYKVNGASSFVISTNSASAVLQITSDTDYLCTIGASSSAVQQIFYTDQITPVVVDSGGLRVLYPFTAPSAGTYIFDATTLTQTGIGGGLSDLTTYTVVNGAVVANSNSPYRTLLQITSIGIITYDMQVTHTQKVEITLAAGDIFYFGATASVAPVVITRGSMIIIKKT